MEYGELTRAERDVYEHTVSGSHHREVELVLIRRSDGKTVGSLTNVFLGGSVQGDTNRSPATVLECQLVDTDYVMDWSHGEHKKYRVEVVDHRFIPALDDWVSETVFTGPMWKFSRTGVVVDLVVEGPELDAEGSIRQAETWPAKTRATEVISGLLRAAGAEARDLRIPRLKAKLPRDVTVGVKRGKDAGKGKDDRKGPRRRVLRVNREDTYYSSAEPIAEAIGRELFTDGRARFVLRPPVTRAQHVLGVQHLLSPASEQPAGEGEVTNTWIIRGANPKGPRKKVAARVELPEKHPESPHSRRWNGTRRHVTETIRNKHLRTRTAARRLGEQRRERAMREQTTYTVEALPIIPWLRPNTLVSVPTSGGRATTRVKQWSLPLGPGADPLTIGTTRRRGF